MSCPPQELGALIPGTLCRATVRGSQKTPETKRLRTPHPLSPFRRPRQARLPPAPLQSDDRLADRLLLRAIFRRNGLPLLVHPEILPPPLPSGAIPQRVSLFGRFPSRAARPHRESRFPSPCKGRAPQPLAARRSFRPPAPR